MSGKIESGQLCTVAPVQAEDLRKGDIVLCKVNGFQYLHLVKAVQGKRLKIGNNRGRINGWIGENQGSTGLSFQLPTCCSRFGRDMG